VGRDNAANKNTQSPVSCSIIVPVYNHWHLVPTLLDCLQRQTFEHENFEVILVENASDAFEPPESMPPNTTIITCDTPGSYAARNRGIARARGRWLVFTDADCRPKPEWLGNLMTAAGQSTVEPANQPKLFAGAVHMVADSNCPNRWEIYDLVRGIPQDWYVKRGYAATANLAVPAALMNRLGGFDAQRMSGGDAELCRRAVGQGAILQFVPEAVVEHPARSSRTELLAKLRRIKAGQVARGDWLRHLRSFLPPVIEAWKYLRATRWPLGYRLTAIAVQLSLWPAEIAWALGMGRGR